MPEAWSAREAVIIQTGRIDNAARTGDERREERRGRASRRVSHRIERESGCQYRQRGLAGAISTL